MGASPIWFKSEEEWYSKVILKLIEGHQDLKGSKFLCMWVLRIDIFSNIPINQSSLVLWATPQSEHA